MEDIRKNEEELTRRIQNTNPNINEELT